MGNTQHFGGRAAEGVGGTRRKQLVNRDSLQMGEQSWLRHYRENNPGIVRFFFNIEAKATAPYVQRGRRFWGY